MAIVLSARAEAEFEQIFEDTITRWGEAQARVYAQKLNKRISLMSTIPGAGRARPDLGEGIRSIAAGSHIIFFKVTGADAIILSVRHAKRREPRLEDLE